MDARQLNAEVYEEKYRQGFGLTYPESHIIRVHRQILEWELKIACGSMFDFGCGSGGNLKYFTKQGFTPYGCDTSATAVAGARALLPEHAARIVVTPLVPDLPALFPGLAVDLFLSNQVLYYLEDRDIRRIVDGAHALVRPGGVFVATMMARSCWYARYMTERVGDFSRVVLDTPRQRETMLINFKEREELPALFSPFRPLHVGFYTWQIREEEGAHDHWVFVGAREG